MTATRHRVPPHAYAAPEVDPSVFVAAGAIVVGDVSIAADASVWFGAVIRGDVRRITIGARSNIQDGAVIHASTGGQPTRIGRDVSIGHGARLHACTIEDGAFVGIGACVLDGATVAAQGMLAAGALLAPGKVVGAGELWVGSPAKFLRLLSDSEKENNKANAARYVALGKHYQSEHPAIYQRSITS